MPFTARHIDEIGTEHADVALALSVYEARHGQHRTASALLGPGVDLDPRDPPASRPI
jgi:hypothetical protein